MSRTVVTTSKREHISPVLAELHWLPVTARIDFKIAVITFNLLTTELPSVVRATTKVIGEAQNLIPHYAQTP